MWFCVELGGFFFLMNVAIAQNKKEYLMLLFILGFSLIHVVSSVTTS